MTHHDPLANRRPLASRRLAVMRRLAAALAGAGVPPNAISAAGIAFAVLAALAFLGAGGQPLLWLVAAVFVQLRLLANLLDGLVAVEGGLGVPTGALWNEVPDRLEDTLILVAFGVAAASPTLGLWSALAAVACAYVRQTGGALGQPQSFAGPMAKQHRMAAVTGGAVLGFGAALAGAGPLLPALVLWVILAGTVLTIVRRLRLIAAALHR
jgi:phosphatidylglycerophosphate synthase